MIFKKIITIVCAVFILSQLPLVGMEVAVYDQPEARFCRYENGQWLFCGHNREWWDENHPGVWERRYEPYGVTTIWNEKESFSRLSEPENSRFEMEVYNSNR